MPEFITSPLALAGAWMACGAIKILIDAVRKEPIDFFSVTNSLVFGPVSLLTELFQLATMRSGTSLKTEAQPLEIALHDDEAVEEAIAATRALADELAGLENSAPVASPNEKTEIVRS